MGLAFTPQERYLMRIWQGPQTFLERLIAISAAVLRNLRVDIAFYISGLTCQEIKVHNNYIFCRGEKWRRIRCGQKGVG